MTGLLRFEQPRDPQVTIVMVTYGCRDIVSKALVALRAHTEPVYELVIVDSASPDYTGVWLESTVSGATVIRSTTNIGYGAGSNLGAARGFAPYVLFLNPDVFVQPGWLLPLLRAITVPTIGAVGPQIRYPNGVLQAAGSLVFRDGSTDRYGDGDREPDAAAYRYLRTVDYLSGACVLVDRALFDRIGGFDPVFGLGYYEDVNLGFAITAIGRDAVYVPASVVSHIGDASGGRRSLADTAKRNREILANRWSDVLRERPVRPWPGDSSGIISARDARAPLRILLLGSGIECARELRAHDYRLAFTAVGKEANALSRYVEVIERADWDSWFESRRSHYDWIVGHDEQFDTLIAGTQPAARRLRSATSGELLSAGFEGRPYCESITAQTQGAGISQLTTPVEIDLNFLQSLGYRFDRQPPASAQPRRQHVPPPDWPASDLYFVTVCSTNHLPFARTLVESLARHHPDVPVVLTIVDALNRAEVDVDGAVVLTGHDVLGDDFDYPSLKFEAFEFCCAAKAATIDYLLRQSPARRFVYLDADIYLFAPVRELIDQLEHADFVVVPHTIAPMPFPDRFWERPPLGGLADAGVFNAGMFALRRSADTVRFIQNLKWLVTAPGAFVVGQGGQAEQQAFNWISCFVESFAVLRDTAYNVAYWNLHDRSLRHVDSAGGDSWTVDGRPLVAFHFSGFSPSAPFRLSRHDNRHNLYVLPAVSKICEFYLNRFNANNAGESHREYRFDRFPSGVRIDPIMRTIFRVHEVFIQAEVDPWTPEGEAHYAGALLSPVPYSGSTAPILVKHIHDIRPDLKIFGDISFDSTALMRWMMIGGVHEYGYEMLFDRHRPVVPLHHGATLLCELRKNWPDAFEGLTGALREQRRELLARLEFVAPAEAHVIRDGSAEQYIATQIGAVRQYITQRPDLVTAFPDFLFDDGPSLVSWLKDKRLEEHFLPEEAIEAFAARLAGRPVARVYSYLSRAWPLMEAFPLALAGERSKEFAGILLQRLRHTIEYDVSDIEMFLWIMDEKPWSGLALTLELPIHSTRHPSSRSRKGQDEILGPLLSRDVRFQKALEAHRLRYPVVDDMSPRSQRTSTEVSVFSLIGRPSQPRAVGRVASGANVFGYHRSDIGLGEHSRNLAEAIRAAGYNTSEVVLGNVQMADDLCPDDFIQKYDISRGVNVFISYPHLQDVLLRTLPDEVTGGHRNIVSLAWEQRSGHHYWADVYAEYDQVWAISQFASQSLAEILRRDVHTVPSVVNTSRLPPAASKQTFGLDPAVYAFLFIFDANSSIERKNPEAVVEAFRSAFRSDDRVRLVVKASNGTKLGNRARIRRLVSAIGDDSRIQFRADALSATDRYGLISAADCYVSLHRAEGFGYTCAEAMAYGKPVVATGYSGNMDFMNESNSYPVRFREVDVKVAEGPFQRGSVWAEPDVEHAAYLMRRVYERRDEAAAKGCEARCTIEHGFSPAAVGWRIRSLLNDYVE